MKFALAHNGVLYNDELLRSQLKLPNTSIQTDSYIAVQLIEHYGKVDFESLKNMAEAVSGSFCFSVLTDRNEVYLVKGSNPLAIYECGGYYVYASTHEILDKTLKRLHIKKKGEVKAAQGEILKISPDGTIERSTFDFDDYEYSKYSYLNALSSYDYDTDELDMVIQYAEFFGFRKEDIIMLIDMGYDAVDIEELLYDPSGLHSIVDEYREMMACEFER